MFSWHAGRRRGCATWVEVVEQPTGLELMMAEKSRPAGLLGEAEETVGVVGVRSWQKRVVKELEMVTM